MSERVEIEAITPPKIDLLDFFDDEAITIHFCAPPSMPSWERQALPSTLNCDGRPIWEPPTLKYTRWIDEEAYTKKRDAILEFTGNDVGRTTRIMDLADEEGLLVAYSLWIGDTEKREEDATSARFLGALRNEVFRDWEEVVEESWEMGVSVVQMGDGTYRVEESDARYTKDYEVEDDGRDSSVGSCERETGVAAAPGVLMSCDSAPQTPRKFSGSFSGGFISSSFMGNRRRADQQAILKRGTSRQSTPLAIQLLLMQQGVSTENDETTLALSSEDEELD